MVAGTTVIATRSSETKAQKLASLSAHHVLKYKMDLNWGEIVKQLTPYNKGVHVVVDVGGLATIGQSLKAVRPDGLISVTILPSDSPDAGKASSLLDCEGCGAGNLGRIRGNESVYGRERG